MPKHTQSARQRQQQDLARMTASTATALLTAVLCIFPLYIDRFSNLGLTKFSGGFTLILLFAAALGACLLIGGKVPAGRFARRDTGTLWLGAFALTGLLSTVTSIAPVSSLWGLGGYYGGFALVVITALAYLCVRAFAPTGDMNFLFFGVGVTASIVTVLYVLNIFNIDLIGAYRDTAVVERAQFFSTLGQKDFNAGFFAIVLPIVFYAWLTAKGRAQNIAYGIPMVFGGLALAVVDAEALTLGVVAAAMVLVCHKTLTPAWYAGAPSSVWLSSPGRPGCTICGPPSTPRAAGPCCPISGTRNWPFRGSCSAPPCGGCSTGGSGGARRNAACAWWAGS